MWNHRTMAWLVGKDHKAPPAAPLLPLSSAAGVCGQCPGAVQLVPKPEMCGLLSPAASCLVSHNQHGLAQKGLVHRYQHASCLWNPEQANYPKFSFPSRLVSDSAKILGMARMSRKHYPCSVFKCALVYNDFA